MARVCEWIGSSMSRTSAYKVRINTLSADSNALILLADGAMVGVLVEMSDECHGPDRGRWTIESAFAIDARRVPSMFASAAEAADWISAHLPCDKFILGGELIHLGCRQR